MLAGLSAASILALMILVCVDVAGRYFFSAPVRGALEIADMLMCVAIFAVLPLATRRELHITIDLVDRALPPPALLRLRRAASLIGALVTALIAWRMWIYAGKIAEYGDRTLFLEIPLYPASYFISVMAGLAALALLVNAFRPPTVGETQRC